MALLNKLSVEQFAQQEGVNVKTPIVEKSYLKNQFLICQKSVQRINS